jgi:hypothetical protein
VETFVERVEHLVRLRDLARSAAGAGGTLTLTVRQAGPEELPPATPLLERVLADARPGAGDVDRRHARAVAVLALGDGVVLGG